MHRLALGAFWHLTKVHAEFKGEAGLNAPYGARCYLTG